MCIVGMCRLVASGVISADRGNSVTVLGLMLLVVMVWRRSVCCVPDRAMFLMLEDHRRFAVGRLVMKRVEKWRTHIRVPVITGGRGALE